MESYLLVKPTLPPRRIIFSQGSGGALDGNGIVTPSAQWPGSRGPLVDRGTGLDATLGGDRGRVESDGLEYAARICTLCLVDHRAVPSELVDDPPEHAEHSHHQEIEADHG